MGGLLEFRKIFAILSRAGRRQLCCQLRISSQGERRSGSVLVVNDESAKINQTIKCALNAQKTHSLLVLYRSETFESIQSP